MKSKKIDLFLCQIINSMLLLKYLAKALPIIANRLPTDASHLNCVIQRWLDKKYNQNCIVLQSEFEDLKPGSERPTRQTMEAPYVHTSTPVGLGNEIRAGKMVHFVRKSLKAKKQTRSFLQKKKMRHTSCVYLC